MVICVSLASSMLLAMVEIHHMQEGLFQTKYIQTEMQRCPVASGDQGILLVIMKETDPYPAKPYLPLSKDCPHCWPGSLSQPEIG